MLICLQCYADGRMGRREPFWLKPFWHNLFRFKFSPRHWRGYPGLMVDPPGDPWGRPGEPGGPLGASRPLWTPLGCP